MAKQKANRGEEKTDDLEITSIGSLYSGPWDKKYWSSSRRKDRYPFPVGYQAVRAYNGNRYTMEIREGPTGPLFIISSSDGHSFSGKTPEIAWDNCQKKSNPRLKIWHGKRFSPKIDGVEFFGFKNPFVQRLLRELVANINGKGDQCLPSSSSYHELSRIQQSRKCPNANCLQDLVPFLARSQTRGKRSRRHEIRNPKSSSEHSLKKYRCQNMLHDAKASSSVQENHGHQDCEITVSSFVKKDECNKPEPSMEGEPKNSGLSEDSLSSPFDDFSDNPREKVGPDHTVSNMSGSGPENCNSDGEANLSAEDNLPYFLGDDGNDASTFHMAAEDQNRDTTSPKEFSGLNDADFCAPNTLELMPDLADCAPNILNDDASRATTRSTSDDIVSSERFEAKSHLHQEINTNSYNASSVKSNFNSVGQETARSMITVLLPQAIPLLKEASENKETDIVSLELNCHAETNEKDNITGNSPDIQRPALGPTEDATLLVDEMMHNQNSANDSVDLTSESGKCVVPDSFEDNQHEKNVNFEEIPPSHIVEANQYTRTLEQLVSADEDSLNNHVDSFPSKKLMLKEIKNVYANLDKNSQGFAPSSVPNSTRDIDIDDATPREVTSTVDILKKEASPKSVIAEASTQVVNIVYKRRKVPKTRKYGSPSSEKIMSQNSGASCVPQMSLPREISLAPEIHQTDFKPSQKYLPCSGGQRYNLQKEGISRDSGCLSKTMTSIISQNEADLSASKDNGVPEFCDFSAPVEKSQDHIVNNLAGPQNLVCNSVLSQKQVTNYSDHKPSIATEAQNGLSMEPCRKTDSINAIEGPFHLLGCYAHPVPVVSVILRTKNEEIYVGVLCGVVAERYRTLFVYKIIKDGPKRGCPSFVGHSSAKLPTLKDNGGREVAVERSGFQFTPDGQFLVLLDSIRMPHCSKGRIDCLCSTCSSNSYEENAVKIVQVKIGHASVTAWLKTDDSLHCLLVCEPNQIVALGESGRLHLWAMNPTWSAHTEESVLPDYDCNSPGIVQLKRIPSLGSLIVGHNGFGEFTVWDISRRVFLTRFSASCTSINEFLPVGLFRWKSEHPFADCSDMEEHNSGGFPYHSDNHDSYPFEGKDIAIWIIVSSIADSDAQHNHILNGCNIHAVEQWRLALLVKSTVILESILDPRAASVGTAGGHGVIGTCDGLLYAWELSTGTKLGLLYHSKGGCVSCITADESRPDALAVANGGRLLVYLHSHNNQAL